MPYWSWCTAAPHHPPPFSRDPLPPIGFPQRQWRFGRWWRHKHRFLGLVRFLRFSQHISSYVVFGWSCLRVDGARLMRLVLLLGVGLYKRPSSINTCEFAKGCCVMASVVSVRLAADLEKMVVGWWGAAVHHHHMVQTEKTEFFELSFVFYGCF